MALGSRQHLSCEGETALRVLPSRPATPQLEKASKSHECGKSVRQGSHLVGDQNTHRRDPNAVNVGKNLESAAPSLPTRERTPGRGPFRVGRVGKASTRAPASWSPQDPHWGEAISVRHLWEDSHQLPGQRSLAKPPWGEPTQTWVVWENLPQQCPLTLEEDFRGSQCEQSSVKNSTLTRHRATHNTHIPGRDAL